MGKRTLKDGDESLGEFVGEQGLGQFAEVLLDHVGHVVGLLVGEVDLALSAGLLAHVAQLSDARAHARLAEDADLVERRDAQPVQRLQDRPRQRLARPLHRHRQRHAENALVCTRERKEKENQIPRPINSPGGPLPLPPQRGAATPSPTNTHKKSERCESDSSWKSKRGLAFVVGRFGFAHKFGQVPAPGGFALRRVAFQDGRQTKQGQFAEQRELTDRHLQKFEKKMNRKSDKIKCDIQALMNNSGEMSQEWVEVKLSNYYDQVDE